jgi:hypothetical protein
MGKKEDMFARHYQPVNRKQLDDEVAKFLENGGKVTKLRPAEGTTDYSFRKKEENGGFDDHNGKTGGVALFGRVERMTVPDEE